MLLNSAAVMVYVERKVAALLQQRHRPVPGRAEGRAPAARRHHQADVQGGAAAAGGRRVPLRARADHLRDLRVCRVRRRAVRRRHDAVRPARSSRCALQVADVNVAILVVFAIASMGVYGIVLAGWSSNSKYSLLGGLRSSAQMISYELSYGLALASVLLARQFAVADRHRQSSGRHLVGRHPALVRVPAAARLSDLHDGRHRGDEPRAVRFSRSGAGARRRLSHRVQQHELRDVLHGGVHQHGHRVGGRDRSVPRRLARAVPARVARLDLVPAQGERDPVLLCLDAVDAAALPLRPADGVRLEGAAAGGRRQPARDGGGSAVLWRV